jgi:hypothetical protein
MTHPLERLRYHVSGAIERGEAEAITEIKPPFDSVTFIMEYEGGVLEEDQIVEGFQALIDSGLVWRLQGHYGRTAVALIEAGLCSRG